MARRGTFGAVTRISTAEYRKILERQGASPTEKRQVAGRQAQANGASWESVLEGLLDLGGWHWDHARPMQDKDGNWRTPLSGKKGAPDYRAVRGAEMIHFEAKSQKAVVSPEQQEWIDKMLAAGQRVYVWRPSDFDEVKAVLLRH